MPPSTTTRLGVIDIGSNTIKLLVAEANPHLRTVAHAIEECRISRGISGDRPVLTDDSMERGLHAIARLAAQARTLHVSQLSVVATSAVRDASNGREFASRIQRHIGAEVHILTGNEEAETIALGLSADPDLSANRDYLHFDLGGGSLECNHIAIGRLCLSRSMPLGAVRLTEHHVEHPHGIFTTADARRIEEWVLQSLAAAAIPAAGVGETIVLTGGAVTLARALIHGVSIGSDDLGSPLLSRSALERLLHELAPLDARQRIAVARLPPNRADVVCGALQILITVLRYCNKGEFQHSQFTLRHGIAVKILGLMPK
jgi:exopolyphosphatase / guanosine-5'-triphosphate,3'-diphosphate pyrophosphatase